MQVQILPKGTRYKSIYKNIQKYWSQAPKRWRRQTTEDLSAAAQPDLCFRFLEGPDSPSATSSGASESSSSPSASSSSSLTGARQPRRWNVWAWILSMCAETLRPTRYCWVITAMAALFVSIVLRAPSKVLTAATKEKVSTVKQREEGKYHSPWDDNARQD